MGNRDLKQHDNKPDIWLTHDMTETKQFLFHMNNMTHTSQFINLGLQGP